MNKTDFTPTHGCWGRLMGECGVVEEQKVKEKGEKEQEREQKEKEQNEKEQKEEG